MALMKKPQTNKAISPMHMACINPNMTVFKKFYTCYPDYSVADTDRRKLLHYAAANTNSDILKYLIDKGAPNNEKDLRNTTPLMIACELARIENIRVLLDSQKSKICRQLLQNLDLDIDEEASDYDIMVKQADLINTKGPL